MLFSFVAYLAKDYYRCVLTLVRKKKIIPASLQDFRHEQQTQRKRKKKKEKYKFFNFSAVLSSQF
jgi:predicted ribosome quality control (RQC) complex YloA/Tae2 family protein